MNQTGLSNQSDGSNRIVWVLVGGCFLLGVLACFLYWNQTPKPEPAIASTLFDDGVRFEIVRLEVSKKLTHERPAPKRWFGLVKRGQSSTYACNMLNVSAGSEDGRFVKGAVEKQSQTPCLMMLLRAFHPDGKPFITNKCLTDGDLSWMEWKDGVLAKVTDGNADYAMDDMDMVLEVEDGAGGWLPMDGPIIWDTNDGHAAALRPAFPRRKDALSFRISRPGHAPVELSLPNPGYAKHFAPFTADPLPSARDHGEIEVAFKAFASSRHGPEPVFDVQTDGVAKDHFDCTFKVSDETGNVYPYSQKGRGFLPGEGVLKLIHLVNKRTETYPYRESEVVIIAEGNMTAAGSLPTAELTAEGSSLGFTEIAFEPPDPKEKIPYAEQAAVLAFRLKGKPDSSQWHILETTMERNCIAIFTSKDRASGVSRNPSSGAGEMHLLGKHAHTFSSKQLWTGDLKPGETFKVGVLKKQPPIESVFFVAVPPAPSANKKK
jgi:hypothetical protein